MNHEARFRQVSPFHLPMSPLWLLGAHVWSTSKTSSSVKSSASFAKVATDLMNGEFVHRSYPFRGPRSTWWMAWTLWRLRLVVLSHIRLISSVKPSWDWSYLHGMSVLILDIMIGQCMCLKFVPLPTLSQPPASNWPLRMVSSWFTRSHRNHPSQPSHNKGFLVSGQ